MTAVVVFEYLHAALGVLSNRKTRIESAHDFIFDVQHGGYSQTVPPRHLSHGVPALGASDGSKPVRAAAGSKQLAHKLYISADSVYGLE